MIKDRRIVGWREWVSLPELGVNSIKAKLDSGAKTSAMHAWDQEIYDQGNQPWVRFCTHPLQHDLDTSVDCKAPLADHRWITNSGGTREHRFVISTTLEIAGMSWPIELSLTNRDEMGFRMLIGRDAMRGHLVVDPSKSYCMGKRKLTFTTPDKKLSG